MIYMITCPRCSESVASINFWANACRTCHDVEDYEGETECWCVDCQATTKNARGYCDDCLTHNCQQDPEDLGTEN